MPGGHETAHTGALPRDLEAPPSGVVLVDEVNGVDLCREAAALVERAEVEARSLRLLELHERRLLQQALKEREVVELREGLEELLLPRGRRPAVRKDVPPLPHSSCRVVVGRAKVLKWQLEVGPVVVQRASPQRRERLRGP